MYVYSGLYFHTAVYVIKFFFLNIKMKIKECMILIKRYKMIFQFPMGNFFLLTKRSLLHTTEFLFGILLIKIL